MKKLLLMLCMLMVSLLSFAGKFVLIPITETNDLVTLFNNNEIQVDLIYPTLSKTFADYCINIYVGRKWCAAKSKIEK
jgi:hypothetical protein